MAGITGSITNSSAGYTISTVCPVDWALAYGDPPSVGFVRKSGGGSTITITDGASSAYTTTDYYHPAAVTWTGGDPVSSGTESWSFTSTNGARVVFPADTTERVVRIYWGTYYDGTSPAIDVTATLSDSSAGPWEPSNHSVPSGSDGAGYIEITYSAGSASQTLTVTIAGVDAGSTALTRLQSAGTISSTELASQDQEGFRFGVDDDTESAHTWAAAQDANLTAPLDTNTLLRVLVDATDDPGATAYTLRYQKGGSGGYVAVPVGASSAVTPPQVTSATVQSITTANASWALTNGRPAASAGDMIVAVVAWDDSTTVSSVTPPAGPNSESAVSIAGPIASASTEMRMQAWYWIATGSWTLGNWTYTPAASETCRQAAFVIPAGQFNAADPIGWANTSASAGTAESTLNSPTGTAEADDGNGRLFIAYGSDADAITAPASGTTTVDNGTTGGVGLCIVSRNTVVANSETITAISATITSDSWAALGFVVKPGTVSNELYISASANITAGGEATTARLTAPSGKTTSDFVTGRRWDDENGTDTIDITADDYTELEWCLKAVSPAEDDDYYEFRVYAGVSALDTYTVTPKWTIGSGAASAALTGASSETSVGTLGLEHALAVTGAEVASAVGTLTAAAAYSVALTGAEVATAVGTLTPDLSTIVALTGVESTAAIGTVTVERSAVLAGNEVETAAGTLTPDLATLVELTGVESGTAVGTVAPVRTVAVSGLQAEVSAGSVLSAPAVDLVGVEIEASLGTLYVENEITGGGEFPGALEGQIVTTAVGTLAVVQVVGLSGAESTAATGTITGATAVALTGIEVETAAGTLTPDLAQLVALTGVEATATAGGVAVAQTVALAGAEVSVAAGTLTPELATIVALTGNEATSAAGTVAPGSSVALSVDEVTASAGAVVPLSEGAVGLSGHAVTTAVGTLAVESTVAISGAEVATAAGTLGVVVGEDVSLELVGVESTIAVGSFGPSLSAGLTGAESTTDIGVPGGYVDLGLTGIEVQGLVGQLGIEGTDLVPLVGVSVAASVGVLSAWVSAGAGARLRNGRDIQRQESGRPRQTSGSRPKQSG